MGKTGLRVCLAGGALAMVTGSARAEFAEIQWSADGTARHEFQVAPGQFAEWCSRLRQGDKVEWLFEAQAPVNFNVHFHEGKDVRYPSRQDGVTKAGGTLNVAVEQDYCWMWSNKSTVPVTVRAAAEKLN